VRVFYLFSLQPLDKKWEVLRNFFPNEDSIDHMTAKESHLDFVSSMRVNSSVLVDRFENIGRSWAVGKFQVIEGFFIKVKFVALLKIFDGHVLKDYSYLTKRILEH